MRGAKRRGNPGNHGLPRFARNDGALHLVRQGVQRDVVLHRQALPFLNSCAPQHSVRSPGAWPAASSWPGSSSPTPPQHTRLWQSAAPAPPWRRGRPGRGRCGNPHGRRQWACPAASGPRRAAGPGAQQRLTGRPQNDAPGRFAFAAARACSTASTAISAPPMSAYNVAGKSSPVTRSFSAR